MSFQISESCGGGKDCKWASWCEALGVHSLGARAKLPLSWGGGQAWKCVSSVSQEWSRVSASVGGYVILQDMGPGGFPRTDVPVRQRS